MGLAFILAPDVPDVVVDCPTQLDSRIVSGVGWVALPTPAQRVYPTFPLTLCSRGLSYGKPRIG